MNILKKILFEKKVEDSNILDQSIMNPETGRKVKVKSALGYDDGSVVKKKAKALVKKLNGKGEEVKVAKNKINKEFSAEMAKKFPGTKFGIPEGLTIRDIIINKNYNQDNKDKVFAYKVPMINGKGQKEIKTVYTERYHQLQSHKKWARIEKVISQVKNIQEKSIKLIDSKDAKTNQSAAIINILEKTGLRVGSEDKTDTGNVGIRTLKKRDIKIKGDVISFDFIGKSNHQNESEITDKKLAKYLQKQIFNKDSEDRVFPDASYSNVVNLLKNITDKSLGMKIKDLRTIKACESTIKTLNDKSILPPPLAKNPKERSKQIKEKLAITFKSASDVLNNSPNMSKTSYIHPKLIYDWLDKLGVKVVDTKGIYDLTYKENASIMKKIIKESEFNYDKKIDPKEYEGIEENQNCLSDDEEEPEIFEIPEWFFDNEITFEIK